ncbi:MAG: DJ-1/PfpI family protein [Terriglobia bacterium]
MKFLRYSLALLLLFLGSGFAFSLTAQDDVIAVGILVYDGVYNTELVAPYDVFQHAATHTNGRLRVFTVAPRFGSVTTAEGLRLLPDYSFLTAPKIDWLVVPSGENYQSDSKDPALVDWIRRTGRQAQVVHSNCWGAFLLGAAGLLDSRRATTFPASLDDFAQAFPKVDVRRDVVFVDDNGVVTSAGGVTSYQAALYLVEKYLGPDIAQKVAEGLVLEWDLARVKHETVPTAAGSP